MRHPTFADPRLRPGSTNKRIVLSEEERIRLFGRSPVSRVSEVTEAESLEWSVAWLNGVSLADIALNEKRCPKTISKAIRSKLGLESLTRYHNGL